MRRVALLGLLAVALPTAALANSITDYANRGTVLAGTATISGSATAGSTLSFGSQLTGINNTTFGNLGWVTVGTGNLSSCSSGLCFTGGSITITASAGATLFHETFTSGTVSVMNGFTFINAVVSGVAGTTQIGVNISKNGNISGDTIVTPEPGTLALLGTGLVGLAGVVRRKMQA
jgi:PEP-CTERM motif